MKNVRNWMVVVLPALLAGIACQLQGCRAEEHELTFPHEKLVGTVWKATEDVPLLLPPEYYKDGLVSAATVETTYVFSFLKDRRVLCAVHVDKVLAGDEPLLGERRLFDLSYADYEVVDSKSIRIKTNMGYAIDTVCKFDFSMDRMYTSESLGFQKVLPTD